jgi:hypothetical protein
MDGNISSFVSIIDVRRLIQAQLEFEDPGNERPSRIRWAVVALGRGFASIVAKAREHSERPELAKQPISSGD